MIPNVDPEASEVPVNGSELRAYAKEQRALTREIADQSGQLLLRTPVAPVAARNPLLGIDESRSIRMGTGTRCGDHA